MSMHTVQDWHGHAAQNMSQAVRSHADATAQCEMSARAHDNTVTENLGQYNQLQSNLEIKVKTSHRLIAMLQKRYDSVEGTRNEARQSLAQLEAALKAKDAPLKLNAVRQEQRETRPLREQVRDNVETALEDENSALMDTQRKLRDAIKKQKGTIKMLDDQLAELRHDIEHKTSALNVDEMCLRTTQRSFQAVVERTSPKQLPTSTRLQASAKMSPSHQRSQHDTGKNEVKRQQQAVRLNQKAIEAEEAAKADKEDNAKLVFRCQRVADEALAKTEKAVEQRVQDNQNMRKRLENKLQETEGKINHTKRTMSETRTQLGHLDDPNDLTSACSSWRQQRPTRECISDPVSTTLAAHQKMLLRAHEDLTHHNQAEKLCLHNLHERREQLKHDLRDKTSALHIDLNCHVHEFTNSNGRATTQMSKGRIQRALKVDSQFVQSPGVRGSYSAR
mmetsp:Transcript_122339/g.346884  ORF Transcript_122339/g.346884 Transcript_122339/m.346884 type:complete len:448 (+) Transcript_122339:71-1414(+)